MNHVLKKSIGWTLKELKKSTFWKKNVYNKIIAGYIIYIIFRKEIEKKITQKNFQHHPGDFQIELSLDF